MDASHRTRFVSVPKRTSWLNRVEIWFSVLPQRVLPSQADSRKRLLDFVDYYDRTMSKPYKWTYAGRPRLLIDPTPSIANPPSEIPEDRAIPRQ